MVQPMPAPVRLMVFEGFGHSGYGAVVSVPVLKMGMTHEEVMRVRAYLAAIYAAKYPGERESFDPGAQPYFDQKLKDAVTRFQVLEGLAVDGVVGPRTWSRLFELANPKDTPVVGSGGGGGGTPVGGDQKNKDEGNFPLTKPAPDTSSNAAAFIVAGIAALGLLWAINKGRK